MRVLLAFDKFKDALTAHAASQIVADALKKIHPEWTLDVAPLADGGEGFVRILTEAAGGRFVSHRVVGPRGKPVTADIGYVSVRALPVAAWAQLVLPAELAPEAEVAVIEMASASGLALLATEQRDLWRTSSVGTGELIRLASAAGAVAIVLGVGGSATHDLGLGALAELGFEFSEASGKTVRPPVPAMWTEITAISGRKPAGLPPLFIACDVANPLLGLRGAAAVYGPQKGLEPADHPRLEHQTERLARMLCAHCHQPGALAQTPGAGAAGGIAFGLMAAVGARLLPGFAFVSAWLDLERKLLAADLVITGEGRFDESSLQGKGPGSLVTDALKQGKRVHVFAGQVTAAPRAELGLHAITPPSVPLAQALREAPANLAASVQAVFSS